MSFKYQEDEILSDSLTVTNFHTYYQGSEMVVAGKMEDFGINPDELIEYKILATQAMGQQYSILGAYNGSEVISKRGLTFLFCQDDWTLVILVFYRMDLTLWVFFHVISYIL